MLLLYLSEKFIAQTYQRTIGSAQSQCCWRMCGGGNKWSLLELVKAILYVLKNGCLWHDVPGEFLPWGTVYGYFSKWQKNGGLEPVMNLRRVGRA